MSELIRGDVFRLFVVDNADDNEAGRDYSDDDIAQCLSSA